ncbi:MAG: NHL repeat-containing protein [Rubripirellula sp.]
MTMRNRRTFLKGCAGSLAVGGLASTGCVPTGDGPKPELVWGRRGISEGRFLKPRAITIDERDQLYIVDTTGRIQVFDTEGKLLRWWTTPQTENGRPTGLAIRRDPESASEDDSTRLLVADTHYYRMLSYTLDGQLLPNEQIGGISGHQPGEFAFVTDAVCDATGCFYIGEYNASDRIQKFDPQGNFITQWGGNGQEPGRFVRPQSLEVRGDVLWVADSCNHRIQRFDIRDETPRLIDVWGGPGNEKGRFYYPYDMAFASDGSLLVIEYKNNRIQRLDQDGKWIASWGGPGFEPGRLNQPWGVVIDSEDRVHVLDSNNHRVQRIELPV